MGDMYQHSHARSTVFTFRLLKLGLPQSPPHSYSHLLWPHLTPAAAHLHSVRLSNEICCLLLMLLLLLAVSLGKRCDLRLGLLHFLVKQNAQKVESIHGQTRASSSWQPDEWTERQTNACYFWPGSGTCPGSLLACLPARLAGCLCIYGIGTMLPAHTNTQTHTHSYGGSCAAACSTHCGIGIGKTVAAGTARQPQSGS